MQCFWSKYENVYENIEGLREQGSNRNRTTFLLINAHTRDLLSLAKKNKIKNPLIGKHLMIAYISVQIQTCAAYTLMYTKRHVQWKNISPWLWLGSASPNICTTIWPLLRAIMATLPIRYIWNSSTETDLPKHWAIQTKNSPGIQHSVKMAHFKWMPYYL